MAGFHPSQDANLIDSVAAPVFKPDFTYELNNFFHPFVGELIKKLNKESLPGLFDPEYHKNLTKKFFGTPFYQLLPSVEFDIISHPKEIDVSKDGPYANYNWELLFHIPFTIAVHLSKNQRFAEAQRWFHYIFDPTDIHKHYWKFLRFRQIEKVTPIDDQLALLSESNLTAEEKKLRDALLASYEQIKNKPFQPHPVAQLRVFPYQYAVVMKYLDNLIVWGDSLFRQDTIESINEATQIYVLAANILGARPQRIPPRGTIRPKTFHQLKHESDHGLDAFSNALVELEGQFPFNFSLPSTSNADVTGPFGSGQALYFCVPPNDKLLGYWDTVADRLFKIRHCMTIEGVVRQLALFDPPLDPGMLVKAAAAGIDIGSIVSGLNQPIGPVRCLFLIQKALELAGEVRGLGNALLSAIEKGDSERLALLRQEHEIKIQQMAQEVRFLQWKQAEESTKSLLRSRASALERYRYYLRLLGQAPDNNAAPENLPLNPRELTEENFDEAYAALVGQYEKTVATIEYPEREIRETEEDGTLHLVVGEYDDLNVHADAAFLGRIAASASEGITAGLAAIPSVNLKMSYWGVGSEMKISGGEILSNIGRHASSVFSIVAQIAEWKGHYASKKASYERRADDWMLQANLAARELMQIGRQIIGSLIAAQIAHHEYLNIQKQIEHSEEVDRFLREKFTNEELYAWMQGEISRLYYEYYRFAFDTARKAEQTMRRELMRPEVDATDYIKFNYWDSGRKGLLSGEALFLDIKRMEMAYHENNKREFELTKHVSLRQLNPLALLTLKATGNCEVTIPEWLYDFDGPGHYMRRLKNVGLSIPSVTGPYTSVSCTLSLLKSSVRKSPLLADGEYPRQGSEDTRFVDYYGTIQQIVTSSGNNDSGLFETNLRDERFLPFEGAGAESKWKLELPASFRQFDYNTISEVILHVRYTARQGGAQLGELMWLEEYQVDGLRWDATAYIRNVYGNNNDPAHDIPDGRDLMRWINNEINARQPWKISIAEDLRNNEWLTQDTGTGGAGFDAQWDAGFVHPIRSAIISANDETRNMYTVRNAITHRYNGDAFARVIYTESHDEVANGRARVPHEIWPDNPGSYFSKKRSTLGAALVFTAPGIPMIFQGQEFLEDEWFHDSDPVDWTKRETYGGILNLYRDLIRLRRNWYSNTRGLRGQHVHVHHVNNDDKVIAFHRWEHRGPGDDVIVVANIANRGYDSYTIGFPREGLWKVRFNSDWHGYSPDFGNHPSYHAYAHAGGKDSTAYNGNVGIGAYSVIVLSQDE